MTTFERRATDDELGTLTLITPDRVRSNGQASLLRITHGTGSPFNPIAVR